MEMEPESDWSLEGHTLCNDIWKKFEQYQYLTPPCSPYRDSDLDFSLTSPLPPHAGLTSLQEPFLWIPSVDLPLLEVDDLKVDLEDIIDLENELDGCEAGGVHCRNAPGRGTCTSCTQLTLAGSELRHDCMWQGTCTAEAHSHSHNHLDTPSQYTSRTHRDSGSHLSDLLLDSSSGALEGALGFTHMSDFEDLQESDLPQHAHPRPDTPSESSETDTDEDEHTEDEDDYGVSHEEVVYTTTTAPVAVHVDHSYHCPRIPSPLPCRQKQPSQPHRSQRHHSRSPRPTLQTPTDSEDEIDVVSVGSPDSAYSSSSSSSGSSKGGGGEDTKYDSEPKSSKQTSPHHTATTTYVPTTTGLKRVVRVRTSSLSVKPGKRARKQIQQVALTARRIGSGGNQTNVVFLRKSGSPIKNAKRLQQQQQQQRGLSRKQQHRRALRNDLDDPDKRHLHNSLERMRRVDQRKAFDDLRIMVPDLAEKDKVPKVEILKMAAKYIYSVTRKERTLEEEKERLQQHHKELVKRTQALRRQVR